MRVYRVRKRRKHYTVVYIASPCLLFFEIFAFLVLFSFFSQTIIGPSSLGFVLKFLRDHRYSDEKKKKCVYIYIYVYVYIHIYICIYILRIVHTRTRNSIYYNFIINAYEKQTLSLQH